MGFRVEGVEFGAIWGLRVEGVGFGVWKCTEKEATKMMITTSKRRPPMGANPLLPFFVILVSTFSAQRFSTIRLRARGNTLQGFNDIHLKAKAGIWP